MEDKYIIGIDPGAKGAIVIFKNGTILKEKLFPTIGKEVDYRKLVKIFKPYRKRNTHIYFENVHARGGGWGATQSFSFGLVVGATEAVILSLKIPMTKVSAIAWQKVALEGIKPHYKQKSVKKDGVKNKGKKTNKVRDNKKMALIAVRRLFPDKTFIPKGCRTPNDGLIDATLIGYYGVLKHGSD